MDYNIVTRLASTKRHVQQRLRRALDIKVALHRQGLRARRIMKTRVINS